MLNLKVQLYREFRGRGHSIEKASAFLQFIKYYARFAKREFFTKFDNEIQSIDQKKDGPMGILELIKQHIVESDLEIAELIEMPVPFILRVRQELLQGN